MADKNLRDKFKNWLDRNKDKEGTDEYNKVEQGYLANVESSVLDKASATAAGANTGLFANILGLPVDAANQIPTLLNLLPGEQGFKPITENPVGGSNWLNTLMTDKLGIGVKDIQKLPTDQRPYAKGGEIFGENVAIMNPFMAAARFGTKDVTKKAINQAKRAQASSVGKLGADVKSFGSDVVDSIRRRPLAATALETGLSISPAIGGGIAEAISPDDPTAQMYGELAGGLSPFATAIALSKVADTGKSIISNFSPATQKSNAAEIVQKQILEQNDTANFENIAKDLQAQISGDGPQGTTAQLMDQTGVNALERALMSDDLNFAGQVKTKREEYRTGLNKQFKELVDSGRGSSDEVSRFADQVLEENKNLIDQNLKAASDALAEKTLDFQDPSFKPEAASVRVKEIVKEELAFIKAAEDELWNAVDKKISIEPKNFLNTVKTLKNDMFDPLELPEPYVKYIKKINKPSKDSPLEKGQTTSGELLQARSNARNRRAELLSNNNFNEARLWKEIGDAALLDLEVIPGPARDIASKFTRERADRYGTGFIERVLKRKKSTEAIINEERVLEKAFEPSSDIQTKLNLKGLTRASEGFIPENFKVSFDELSPNAKQILNKTGANQSEMIDLQKSYLKNEIIQSASKSVDDEIVIDPKKLDRFIKNNMATLEELGLKDEVFDLKNLANKKIDAETELKTFETDKSKASKSLLNNLVNSSDDHVTKIVAKSISNPSPTTNIRQIILLLRSKGPNPRAIEGLRYHIFDSLLQASRVGENVVGTKFRDLLKKSFDGRKGESLENVLLDESVINRRQIENINLLARNSKRLEENISNFLVAKDYMPAIDQATDTILTIGGARLGSAASSQVGNVLPMPSGGASLIAASKGSKVSKFLGQFGSRRTGAILREAMINPNLMVELLNRPTSVAARRARIQRLNAILIQAGILATSETLSEEGLE